MGIGFLRYCSHPLLGTIQIAPNYKIHFLTNTIPPFSSPQLEKYFNFLPNRYFYSFIPSPFPKPLPMPAMTEGGDFHAHLRWARNDEDKNTSPAFF